MKVVVYTRHAEQRLKERRISKKRAEEVLELGESITWRNGAQGKEYKGIKVVYEEKDDIIDVITAYKVIKSLEELVDTIPAPHEWWKSENREAFIMQAYYLKEFGLEDLDIIEHLKKLYSAVCGEFGE